MRIDSNVHRVVIVAGNLNIQGFREPEPGIWQRLKVPFRGAVPENKYEKQPHFRRKA